MIDREVGATFDRRSALLLGGAAALTLVLVARMLQMQLFQHGKYKKLSERNSYRTQINLPERGKILGSGNTPMAKDTPIYRVYIIPDEADDLTGLLAAVKRELNLKPSDIDRIHKRIQKQRGFQPALVKENTNWEQLAGLQTMNLNGLHIERGFSRRYPLGPAGAQAIGYLGVPGAIVRPDQEDAARSPFFMTGQAGLEKAFDAPLSGTVGKTALIVDAMGRVTGKDQSLEIRGTDGKNLQTTLSEPIVRKLYDLLEPNKSGCGIVMAAQTGEILAMVSAPSYDANNFKSDDSAEMMQDLLKNPLKPFMNKTLEGLYPPGSTFKVVVALAALESGAITPTEKIHCTGEWEYGNHLYHCWEKHGHGWMDMVGALQHSCDIYFYQVALRTGIEAINNMAARLGLGQVLLSTLPREMAGIVPDKTWKEKNIGQRWQHGDTIISGIGQGFVLANCLQLATMLARVSTNSVVMPRLVTTDPKPEVGFGSLGLQQKNIDIVLKGLEKVLQEGGTAAGAAINIRGSRMGGKTGTSQVRSISKKERDIGVRTNEQLPWDLRNHGLFVGYAPTDRPKYIVSVVTEHSGSSGPAARVAAGVMKQILLNDKMTQ